MKRWQVFLTAVVSGVFAYGNIRIVFALFDLVKQLNEPLNSLGIFISLTSSIVGLLLGAVAFVFLIIGIFFEKLPEISLS